MSSTVTRTVYLAGPMTGRASFNAEGFNQARIYAAQQGLTPVSPQDTDPAHDGPCPPGEPQTTAVGSHPWQCWVKAGLQVMLRCDEVLLLPGWFASRGASLEARVALDVGLPLRPMPDRLRVFAGCPCACNIAGFCGHCQACEAERASS